MEKIVGVIPARFASSRLPGKPLISILGKELILRVCDIAKNVPELDAFYVATDDIRIKELCEESNINVIMTSLECKSGTDRICEAISNIEADYIINIQGDEPLFESENISKIIDYYKFHKNVDVLNVMTKIRNPFEITDSTVVKVAFTDDKQLLYLSRSPVPGSKKKKNQRFYKHCGIYGMTRKALDFFGRTEKGRIEKEEDIEMFRFLEHGYQITVLEIETDSIGVDTVDDVKRVEKKIEERYIQRGNG